MVKRLYYIDIAKAIAILLVIFGHTFRESMRAEITWCNWSYLFVYRFHVSLLFLLSGMGYALSKRKNVQRSTRNFAAGKAKKLLLPWFSYSVLIYVVFAVLQCVPHMRELLADSAYALMSPLAFAGKLLQNENPYAFHVWYLQTLFLFVMCAFLLDKYLTERHAKTVKVVVILAAPLLYELFCTGLCWTMKGFAQKIMFFLLGTCLSDETVRCNAKKFVLGGIPCGILTAILSVAPVVQKIYNNRPMGIGFAYVEHALIVGWCLGILGFCVLVEEKGKRLAAFGKDTMVYYLYHQPFCCAFLGLILYDKMHLPAWAVVMLCMMASLGIPYVGRRMAKKIHLDRILQKIGLPI